jgi:hypothetical protein
VRYQFPLEGEPGLITMAPGPSTIGFGAGGADDDDRCGYWVYVADVDATLGPVLTAAVTVTPSTASTAATLAGLRAAGVPVVGEPEDQPLGRRRRPRARPGRAARLPGAPA